MINFITAITSALFGALVVIVTNWWRTRYTIREQDFSKRVEEIIKKLRRLKISHASIGQRWILMLEVKSL